MTDVVSPKIRKEEISLEDDLEFLFYSRKLPLIICYGRELQLTVIPVKQTRSMQWLCAKTLLEKFSSGTWSAVLRIAPFSSDSDVKLQFYRNPTRFVFADSPDSRLAPHYLRESENILILISIAHACVFVMFPFPVMCEIKCRVHVPTENGTLLILSVPRAENYPRSLAATLHRKQGRL